MIYAFEGPSGSGKGYACQCWVGKEDTLRLERPVLPRCLDNWAGAWSSSFLEYQAIAAATMSGKDVLVDRFLLSRWVYRAMQFNNDKLTNRWYEEMVRSVRRLKALAVAEACDRMGSALYLHPGIDITVLIPDVDELYFRRSKAHPKPYPFNGITELQLYLAIAEKLIQDPITGITVHIDRS